MVKEHPANLPAFVAGRLSEEETQAVLDHLATCDTCLAAVDALWPELDQRLVPALGPELPEERAMALESRLLSRMHRTNLGARILWFSTQGLAQVALAFLQPLLGGSRPHRRPPARPVAPDDGVEE